MMFCLVTIMALVPLTFGHDFIPAHASGQTLPTATRVIEIPAWAASPYDAEPELPSILPDGRPVLPRHGEILKALENKESQIADVSPFGPRRPTLDRHRENPFGEQPTIDEDEFVGLDGFCPKSDFSACLSPRELDNRVEQCCLDDVQIPQGCLNLCSTSVNFPQLLQSVNGGQCSWPNIQRVLKCHSGGEDVSSCCDQQALNSNNRAACGAFCNPSGGIPRVEPSLLACPPLFDAIKSCYYAYQN